ncbi:MAG: DUF2442 domain-containing protein [Candidatus Limnocylindria bacterium]
MTRPALAADVRVTDSRLSVVLTDGREVSVPVSEFPELAAATPEQRANWRITALGTAIYWPDIDEEFGLAGMLGVSETLLEEAAGFEIHDLR